MGSGTSNRETRQVRSMSLIDELMDTGLLDRKAVRTTDRKLTVFEDVHRELAHGEAGREVERILRKQTRDWNAMAHQVVGDEDF